MYLAQLSLCRRTLRINIFTLLQAQEVSIPLEDPKATIFSYIHKLALLSGKMKAERLRRIWEPTYT